MPEDAGGAEVFLALETAFTIIYLIEAVIKTIALDLVFDGVCTEFHHHGVLPALVAAR